MFICDRIGNKIWFFDGIRLNHMVGDFDDIYKYIRVKFPLVSNLFIDYYGNYCDTGGVFRVISIKHSTIFEIEERLINKIGYKKVLQYICAFSIDEYLLIESGGGESEIYGIIGNNFPTKKIKSKEELIKLGFIYDTVYQNDTKLYVCYAQFSLARGNYSKSSYISTDGIGVDYSKNISIEKALSECIERASGSYYDLSEIISIGRINKENAKIICDYGEKVSDELKGNILHSLYSDQRIFLPENFLYYPCGKRYSYETNSSGMATHITLEKSIIGGLLELIERDAFIYSWLIKSKKIRRIDDKQMYNIVDFDILKSEGIEFSCFILDSSIPVFSIMGIMEKNGKNIISLGCDFLVEDSIAKAFQEGMNARHLFDSTLKSSCVESMIMNHIYYYLDPQNSYKLDRIKKAPFNKETNSNRGAKNYKELISWFEKKNIDIRCYEFINELNNVFSRKTVRVFSQFLVPVYFGSQIPSYFLNHLKFKGKKLNTDLHPLG